MTAPLDLSALIIPDPPLTYSGDAPDATRDAAWIALAASIDRAGIVRAYGATVILPPEVAALAESGAQGGNDERILTPYSLASRYVAAHTKTLARRYCAETGAEVALQIDDHDEGADVRLFSLFGLGVPLYFPAPDTETPDVWLATHADEGHTPEEFQAGLLWMWYVLAYDLPQDPTFEAELAEYLGVASIAQDKQPRRPRAPKKLPAPRVPMGALGAWIPKGSTKRTLIKQHRKLDLSKEVSVDGLSHNAFVALVALVNKAIHDGAVTDSLDNTTANKIHISEKDWTSNRGEKFLQELGRVTIPFDGSHGYYELAAYVDDSRDEDGKILRENRDAIEKGINELLQTRLIHTKVLVVGGGTKMPREVNVFWTGAWLQSLMFHDPATQKILGREFIVHRAAFTSVFHSATLLSPQYLARCRAAVQAIGCDRMREEFHALYWMLVHRASGVTGKLKRQALISGETFAPPGTVESDRIVTVEVKRDTLWLALKLTNKRGLAAAHKRERDAVEYCRAMGLLVGFTSPSDAQDATLTFRVRPPHHRKTDPAQYVLAAADGAP
jgi:hypothetical protein